MCRLLIVRPAVQNETNIYFNDLVKALALASYNADNKDGFALLTEDNKTFRTLDFKKYLNKIDNLKPQKVVLHLRKATTGSINEGNIHLWKVGNYIIAHNGQVMRYKWRDSLKDEDKTDSLEFFEENQEYFERAFDSLSEADLKELLRVMEDYTLKGVYFVRDTKRYLELLTYERPIRLAKFYFKNGEVYHVLSSKKDVVEDFKKLAVIRERTKRNYLFLVKEKIIEKPLSILKEIKNIDVVKEGEESKYTGNIFTKIYPEELLVRESYEKPYYYSSIQIGNRKYYW